MRRGAQPSTKLSMRPPPVQLKSKLQNMRLYAGCPYTPKSGYLRNLPWAQNAQKKLTGISPFRRGLFSGVLPGTENSFNQSLPDWPTEWGLTWPAPRRGQATYWGHPISPRPLYTRRTIGVTQ